MVGKHVQGKKEDLATDFTSSPGSRSREKHPGPGLTWRSQDLEISDQWLSINSQTILANDALYFSINSLHMLHEPCKPHPPHFLPALCCISYCSEAASTLCFSPINLLCEVFCVLWLYGIPWLSLPRYPCARKTFHECHDSERLSWGLCFLSGSESCQDPNPHLWSTHNRLYPPVVIQQISPLVGVNTSLSL